MSTGSTSGESPEYWFCLKHHAVEGRDGCRNADRLGPYATYDEAAHAMDKVEERNEAWEHDPAWNDDSGDGPADDEAPDNWE